MRYKLHLVKTEGRRIIKCAGLFFCALLLAACGSDKLYPLSATDTILAFGDSLTAGVGTNPENSYPAVLAELSQKQVINAGISGETTSEGVERFEALLLEHRPALVILLEGGNDILRNINSDITKMNLDRMIRTATDLGVQVVLIAVPEKNLFSESSPIYPELATEHELVLIKDLISSLLKKPSMKSDAVHFNQQGYRAIATKVFKVLEDNGAL